MPPKGEMTELVKRVMRDAHVGRTDDELAALLAPHLKGFVFEGSALASWRSGRYRPTAEAIFAIALATGLRLDDYLFGTSTGKRLESVEAQLGEVLATLGRLEGGRRESDAPPPGDS